MTFASELSRAAMRSDRKRTRRQAWLAVAAILLGLMATASVRGETWAEKLGYPPGKRVLILHASDAGMCHEANSTIAAYLEGGPGRSASAMSPGPWFGEVGGWSRQHADVDLGLQFTLNSEFVNYRWGPVSSRTEVSTLVDAEGYFWRSVLHVAVSASAAEVEREMRAQLARARASGVQPGHFSTHLGALVSRADLAEVYLRVARENWIPAVVVELTPEHLKRFREQGFPLDDAMISLIAAYPLPKLDDLRFLAPGKSYEETRTHFVELVRSLTPGITQISLRPLADSDSVRHLGQGWQERVWEAQLLSDPAVWEFLGKEDVVHTDWKEMMRRFEGERRPPTAPAETSDK